MLISEVEQHLLSCRKQHNTKEKGFSLGVYTWGISHPPPPPPHMAGTSARGQIVNGETCTTTKVIPMMSRAGPPIICCARLTVLYTVLIKY